MSNNEYREDQTYSDIDGFVHPRCEDCDALMYLDSSEPYCGECVEEKSKKEEEYCWKVNCDKCGKICGKEECPFSSGYDPNEKFICDLHPDEEEELICGNVIGGKVIMGCGGKTYRSEQGNTWQYGWYAFCKDCQ